MQLRNQAYLRKFQSKVELLEAFENVTPEKKDRRIRFGRTGETKGRGGDARSAINGRAKASSAEARRMESWRDGARPTAVEGLELSAEVMRMRCYRCGEAGHVATRCEKPQTRYACYVCGS